MTDRFGRDLIVGDYVIKLSKAEHFNNMKMFRVFGFDEEKGFVYIAELNNIFKNFDEKEFQTACESVKEYYKENCGMYGPTKRIPKDKIVKTYPPV